MKITTQKVWTQFADELRGFIFKRVQSADHTDDILQEAFLRIHLHLDKLESEEKVRAWVYRIVRNLLNDHYKAQGQMAQLNEASLSTDEDFEEELIHCLDPMINALPAMYREALVLSDIRGIKQSEIAKRLGLSLSATKSRIQRARKQLQENFVSCCHFQLDQTGKLKGDNCIPEHCTICNEQTKP